MVQTITIKTDKSLAVEQGKQQVFIETYLRTLNFITATEAAGVDEEAGEKLLQTLSHYLTEPGIIAVIAERQNDLVYNDLALMAHLSKLVMHTLDDFLSINKEGEFAIDLAKARRVGAMGSVKKFTVDRYGKVVLDMYDRLEAITLLLRLRGFNTGTSASGRDSAGAGNGQESVNFNLDDLITARKQALSFESELTAGEEGGGDEDRDEE